MKEYVFLLDGEKAVLREVKTGIQDNTHIQILEGLQDNDEVITGPYSAVSKTLKDKDQVKKVDKNKLFEEKKK
jgi:HlyD family secretion protein